MREAGMVNVMGYIKKNKPKMKNWILIFFSISIIAGCSNKKVINSNSTKNSESFISYYISALLHDCKINYGGPRNSWDCCCEDVDRIKSFSHDTIELLIKNHKIADSVINDKDIYDLLSQTIFPITAKFVPDSEVILLQQETFTHLGSLNYENFILYDTTNIDKNDVLFLFSQLSCESYFWNESKIKNVKCISTEELKDIWYISKNTPKDSIRNILKNRRKIFKQKYKREFIEQYSKPIFNKEKTFAIIEHNSSYWGELIFFKKSNNKWKVIAIKDTWIS
jgi:hypothetical protein